MRKDGEEEGEEESREALLTKISRFLALTSLIFCSILFEGLASSLRFSRSAEAMFSEDVDK